jgi:hypothetical protein
MLVSSHKARLAADRHWNLDPLWSTRLIDSFQGVRLAARPRLRCVDPRPAHRQIAEGGAEPPNL